MLTGLGVANITLGFIGGFAGDEMECRLASEGVHSDFVRISGETRTNIILHETNTGRQTPSHHQRTKVTPYELGSLLKKMDELKDASIIAMGGSLPTGVPPETYRRTILMFKSKGVSTLLDADGDALRTGIEGGPDYIKPNLHELSQLVGRELSGIDDITEAAEWVRSKGVGTVLVSMGADGILLVGENKRYWAVPPKIEAVNTVGVGDSSVAGFVYGLATGLDLRRIVSGSLPPQEPLRR